MNKCYDCKHRGELPGDAHSRCNHPEAAKPQSILYMGHNAPFNIRANPYGVKRGWFLWPLTFDPVWLENCDAFEGVQK